ncbi:hypothetical protein AAC387_Pa08g0903 [Persea americana]
MHFSNIRNITSPHPTLGQEIDVDNIEDRADYGDENHFDETNFRGEIPVIVMGPNKCNVTHANPVNNACVNNIEEFANYSDENQFDENNITGQIPVIMVGSDRNNVAGANPVNNACPSSKHSGVDFVGNMVPEELNANVGNNSAREMWIGREFPDRDTFQKTLSM